MVRKVLLFPTYDQALNYRKRLATAAPSGLFDVTVTTPNSWLQDTWELYGDGRMLVSSLERSFAVREVLAQSSFAKASAVGFEPAAPRVFGEEANSIAVSDGLVTLASRFFAESCGSAQLEDALACAPSELSDQERELLVLVEPYRNLLSSRGMIETGDALRILADAGHAATFEMPQAFSLPPAFKRFVEKVSPETLADIDEPRITRCGGEVAPRFLFAAGPTSQNALLAREIITAAAEECATILVASANPLDLYNALAAPLAAAHIGCAVHARKPFAQTDFGRAYTSIMEFLTSNDHSPASLQDFLDSPFSGIDNVQASQTDSLIRGNRLLSFEDLRAMARLMSPYFDSFEELAADADASVLLDYFTDVATELPGRDAAYISEQTSAIAGLRKVYETARAWQVSPADFTFALQLMQVDVSRTDCEQEQVRVEIVSTKAATDVAAQACSHVFVCDLDARFWPASGTHNALITLQEKLGLACEDETLAEARRTFETFKAYATNSFVCQRVLEAGGDEDVYPAFVLEEFIETYRDADEELDRFGLPAALSTQAQALGEEELAANASVGATDSIELPAAAHATLSDAAFPLLFTSSSRSFQNPEALILSPSAIEAYVNCPYSWFVSRRVCPEAPDEGFGPLEQGTFVHAVYEAFYQRVPAELNAKRVTPENLEQARVLMARVFDEQLALQPQLETTRLVPITPTERAEAQRLKNQLIRGLALHARMLPSFAPVEHEHEITSAENITYAGAVLRGRVDRIDVSADGASYVVIDYKGGIVGHEAGHFEGDAFMMPHKIQALIYAQALRKTFPQAHPVGALYLSYRAREAKSLLSGSCSQVLHEAEGFASKKCEVQMNFETYLNEIETQVARCLDEMRTGYIEPRPLCVQSCKYCPVPNCERRLS